MDLPAFGSPSRPTSAITFSSSFRVRRSPGEPGPELARRAVHAALEARVAPAALAALGHLESLTRFTRSPSCSWVSASNTMVPTGHRDDISSPPRPVSRCLASLAMPGLVGARVAEVRQRIDALRGLQEDAAASPAIAAVGPPKGMNFSRRKLTQPRPPLPAITLMRGFVYELHGFIAYATKKTKSPGRAGASCTRAASSTLLGCRSGRLGASRSRNGASACPSLRT